MDLAPNEVRTLGECLIDSPLDLPDSPHAGIAGYVSDSLRIRLSIEQQVGEPPVETPSLEKAGPRARIYFRPGYTRAAIMTCGGLSPGLNNVIRSLYLQLFYRYGVKTVLGLRDGYRSLNPKYGHQPILLTSDVVERIHRIPGTILGTSRGKEDPALAVDTLDREGINILFVIGGDGTLKGAHRIWEEADRRGLKIAVVGVPKTIDNDINFVYKTFGFDTAVEQATKALDCAHTEAHSHPHGIGLVKIMGRDSGFVVAYAALASRDVNFALIPEVAFDLEGDNGLLPQLLKRLESRNHALIAVAEGAGQSLIAADEAAHRATDASGNVRHHDVGSFLREQIHDYFEKRGVEVNLKYIDPSYTLRSVLPNANDSIYCDNLSRYAVHAAMAGKTDLVIGQWHSVFTHVPMELAIAQRKTIHPESTLWLSVLEATGQPRDMTKGKTS
ncbi:MAG: ATP-dependent 6-phosphofructokinase [Vicinamibacterales bacterium]